MAAGSALWLLEAKPFAQEDRSAAACNVKYWLKPGTVVVGRPGADVVVDEDKSISRKHAEITVLPAQHWQRQQAAEEEGSGPFVLVKDKSKYGTTISPAGGFTEAPLGAGVEARVPPSCMLRFGFKSPFKLYHQDWVLYLSTAQRQATDAATLAHLEAAAAATGLPLTDQLPEHPGTRVLALGAAALRIDGSLMLALLRGYPIVNANWLLEWQQHKVWCNRRPEESSHPAQLQYSDAGGRLHLLPATSPVLLAAAEQQLLAGRTLLWLPPARDAALQEAAAMLGAATSEVAAAGRAPAAAKVAGAVLVRGGGGDALPAAYKRLPWTTPDMLMAGILEGSLDTAVHPPAAADANTTPPAGKKAAPASRSTTGGGKGRREVRGRAAQGEVGEGEEGHEEQQGHESGSETDVSEDLSHLRSTQRVLAAAAGKPELGRQRGAAEHQQQPQQQAQQQAEGEPTAVAGKAATPARHGKKAAPAAQAPASMSEVGTGKATGGGRKRRQAEAELPEQQLGGKQQAQRQPQAGGGREKHHTPAPAKRQRQGGPQAVSRGGLAAGAAAAAAGEATPAAQHAHQELLQMSAAEGWHNRPHQQAGSRGSSPSEQAAAEQAAAGSAARPAPTAAAASAAKRTAARASGLGGTAAAAAVAVAAAAAAVTADLGDQGDTDLVSEDGSLVAYVPLIVTRRLSGSARGRGNGSSTTGGYTGLNFKAFRKAGSSASCSGRESAAARLVVGYDAEPYAEDGLVNADAFLKAEADRRRRVQQADELFAANVKAKKAAQLPDPDQDGTPPKGRARAPSTKMAAAAAAASAGQQSMLNFLPRAGAGRGRGAAGRGRGKG